MTKVAFVGDSLTAGSGATSIYKHYPAQLAKILGAKVASDSTVHAVGGDKSADVLARMNTVLAGNPGLVVLLVGTNDSGWSVPVTTFQANVQAIADMCEAAGARLAVCTIPPRATGGVIMDFVQSYNLFLRAWAADQGHVLVDAWAGVVDIDTGLMKSSHNSGDGVHLTDTGYLAIASQAALVLDDVLVAPSWPVRTGDGGLLPDPLLLGTLGGLGVAGWEHLAGDYISPTLVDADEPGLVNWIHFALNNVGGSTQKIAVYGARLGVKGTDWDEGDEILVAMHPRASTPAAINKIQLQCPGPVGSILAADYPISLPGPLLRKAVIPAGLTGTLRIGIAIRAGAGETVWVEVGATNVYNLTKMGLAGLEV